MQLNPVTKGVLEGLKKIHEIVHNDLVGNRGLTYKNGSIGITTLLGCHKKYEFSKEFGRHETGPNITIDDGYMFENMFGPHFQKAFPKAETVHHDPDIHVTLDDRYEITMHPDFLLEWAGKPEDPNYKPFSVILEFKCPIILTTSYSFDYKADQDWYVDVKDEVHVDPKYLLQAKIQKSLMEIYYQDNDQPNRRVFQYVVGKSTAIVQSKFKKIFVLKPIIESFTRRELVEMFIDWEKNPGPRAGYECPGCNFGPNGTKVCEGMPYKGDAIKNIDEDTLDLIRRQNEVKAELELLKQEHDNIETTLKKKISGNFKHKGKKVGWVDSTYSTVNLKEAYKLMGDELFDFLSIKSKTRDSMFNTINKRQAEEKASNPDYIPVQIEEKKKGRRFETPKL